MKVTAKAEQFVTDATGKRVGVLLDLRTYDLLREAQEELADIRAYDVARPKVHAELKAGQSIFLSEFDSKRPKRLK
jgi:hypothetical protein